MPESSHSREHILAEAARKTGDYQWMEGATLFDQALGLGIEAVSEQARVTASMAKCYFEGAFQAETRDSFKNKMGQAQTAYEKAQELYFDAGLEPRSRISEARGLFAEYWIRDSSDERRELVQRAISTVEDSVKALRGGAETSTLAEAEKDLLTYHLESLQFNLSFKAFKEETDKMARTAEDAIVLYRDLDSTSLLECMCIALTVSVMSQEELGIGSRAEVFESARQREREMREIAEKLGTPYPRMLSAEASAIISHVLQGNFSEGLMASEEALGLAERTGDKSLIGRATSWVASACFWMGIGEEDLEKKRESLERGGQEALKAIEILKVPLMKQFLSQALGAYAESNTVIAITVETEPSRKKERLRKAIEVSRQGMKGETDPGILGALSHSLSKALLFLATLDVSPEEKSELLEESLRLRQEVVRLADSKLAPNTWDQGVSRNYLALVKAELASIHQDNHTKVDLLESACIDMQKFLSICSTSPTPGQFPVVAQYAEWYGDVAVKLLQLTASSDASHQATRAYETAIDYNVKIGHLASVPNIRWKLATAYDQSAQYGEASREFQLAAKAYRAGANKLPACEACFVDNAFYMEAWSFIETARLHHGEEQYLLAAEEYQKTADVLKRATQWAPLARHYLGCSYLEGGEALARQERPESSKESFRTAVTAFQESRIQLGDPLKEEQDPERIKEMKGWVELNSGRERYCLARTQLEEAKLLDKTGEKGASSSKYRSASASFKALIGEAQNEQAKSELGILSLLCEAWAKMKEAAASASPELYASAAEIFLATEKTTSREKLRVLAIANASICKALEAGTRFRRTRNTDLYAEIKKQLEASADYYRERGSRMRQTGLVLPRECSTPWYT